MEHGVDDADSRIWRHWILRILIIDDHNAVHAAAVDVLDFGRGLGTLTTAAFSVILRDSNEM